MNSNMTDENITLIETVLNRHPLPGTILKVNRVHCLADRISYLPTHSKEPRTLTVWHYPEYSEVCDQDNSRLCNMIPLI